MSSATVHLTSTVSSLL